MNDDATAEGIAPLDALLDGPRTYTPWRWAADIARLMRACPRLLAIYGRTRVDAATRERVTVAVSHANACAACTRVHEAWALACQPQSSSRRRRRAFRDACQQRAAIVYVTALAEAPLGPVPDDIGALVNAHLDPDRRRDIAAIARLMTFANLTANAVRVLTRSS